MMMTYKCFDFSSKCRWVFDDLDGKERNWNSKSWYKEEVTQKHLVWKEQTLYACHDELYGNIYSLVVTKRKLRTQNLETATRPKNNLASSYQSDKKGIASGETLRLIPSMWKRRTYSYHIYYSRLLSVGSTIVVNDRYHFIQPFSIPK